VVSLLPATGQAGTGQTTSISTYLYPGGPLMGAAFDGSGHAVRQMSYGYDAAGTSLRRGARLSLRIYSVATFA
jgi:hypothetical protein